MKFCVNQKPTDSYREGRVSADASVSKVFSHSSVFLFNSIWMVARKTRAGISSACALMTPLS